MSDGFEISTCCGSLNKQVLRAGCTQQLSNKKEKQYRRHTDKVDIVWKLE